MSTEASSDHRFQLSGRMSHDTSEISTPVSTPAPKPKAKRNRLEPISKPENLVERVQFGGDFTPRRRAHHRGAPAGFLRVPISRIAGGLRVLVRERRAIPL